MKVSPARILELNWGFAQGRVLCAALETGVFEALADGPATASEVARRCRVSARAMRMVLDALASMEFLEKRRAPHRCGQCASTSAPEPVPFRYDEWERRLASDWSYALALQCPHARVAANDFPEVLPVARKYVRMFGLAKRFSYVAGDLGKVDFGRNRFDLAILGNICHSEGARKTRHLFANVCHALKPCGLICILDHFLDGDRKGPLHSLLLAINMFVGTDEGDVFTQAEYRAWLKEAGFGGFFLVPLRGRFPLLLARKPPSSR